MRATISASLSDAAGGAGRSSRTARRARVASCRQAASLRRSVAATSENGRSNTSWSRNAAALQRRKAVERQHQRKGKIVGELGCCIGRKTLRIEGY
jgi:hypothetical protein